MGNSIQRQLLAVQDDEDDEAFPFNRLPMRDSISPDLLDDLIRRGLDVDLALVPFQMERLKEEENFEIGSKKEFFQDSNFIQSEFNISKNSFQINGSKLVFKVDCSCSCIVTLNLSVDYPLKNFDNLKNTSKKAISSGIDQHVEFDLDMKEIESLAGIRTSKEYTPIMISCELIEKSDLKNLNVIVTRHISHLAILKEDERFKVIVERQFLNISNIHSQGTYLVQDLYGKNNRRRSSLNSFDGGAHGDCVICMSNSVDTAALPCRHLCLCNECAVLLRNNSNKCPVCRSRVSKMVRLQRKEQVCGQMDYNTFPLQEVS
jgi:hypothetical protein